MIKIIINTDTVNNTIPTTILLDKATTNNSLEEEEVGRVGTGLREDEKVKLKEEAVLVEEGMDDNEKEVGRVETELEEDEKVKLKEEAVLVEEGMDDKEEDGTVEVEESAVKRFDVNLQKNQCMVFCMLKSLINMQKID